MPPLHKLFRFAISLSLATFVMISLPGFVVVDCRTESADRTLCTSIIGGAGDNQITIDAGTTVSGPLFGDGILSGTGGDDTIINNGTTIATGTATGTNGDIEGDVIALGNGGNDTLINNGTVAGDMDGDTALNGNGGNDIIINNGMVGDDMDGDNASRNGGDDLIINNGTVGGDIQGDDNTDAQKSLGGDDIITINGVVEGSVYGDFGVHTGGDDTVILQNGANGGSDNRLSIDGNDGDDTLVFNFTLNDQSALEVLAAQITNANPDNGSLTFNGQTFNWKNFEHLQNQLVLADAKTVITVVTGDHPRAVLYSTGPVTAAAYCMPDGISLMGSDEQGRSVYLFSVKADTVATALQQAAANQAKVELGTTDGQSLWALPDGDLSLTDSEARYTLAFAGNVCAGRLFD